MERPILFSTPMVQAILAGNKTMTRRTKGLTWINDIPFSNGLDKMPFKEIGQWFIELQTKVDESERILLKCPYGQIGDTLWVKETSLVWHPIGGEVVYKTDPEYDHCHADMIRLKKMGYPKDDVGNWKVVPSLFMSRTASRISLEITDIKVERLRGISGADATREGIESMKYRGEGISYRGYKCYTDPTSEFPMVDPVASFGSLWVSINGVESWQANPWVWVISFKLKA